MNIHEAINLVMRGEVNLKDAFPRASDYIYAITPVRGKVGRVVVSNQYPTLGAAAWISAHADGEVRKNFITYVESLIEAREEVLLSAVLDVATGFSKYWYTDEDCDVQSVIEAYRNVHHAGLAWIRSVAQYLCKS